MNVLTADAMRAWEQAAFQGGLSESALMRAAVEAMEAFLTSRFAPTRAVLLIGKGNNGNDTLWLGTRLLHHGWQVSTLLADPPDSRLPHPAPETAFLLDSAQVWQPTSPPLWPAEPVCLIDGLLGIGAEGPPRGATAEILDWVASHRRPADAAIAIDCPSGLHPDTGQIHPPCFQADWTLALGAVKTGCLAESARSHVGRLYGLPLPLPGSPPSPTAGFVEDFSALPPLPRLNAGLHKNSRGTVAIWAGSPGMAGAAILACNASLHAGAGRVRLFTHPQVYPVVASAIPEVTVHALDLNDRPPSTLLNADAILAGPGLGTDPATRSFLHVLRRSIPRHMVLDADALHILPPMTQLHPGTILTPHGGEWRAIIGRDCGREDAAHWFRSHCPHIVAVLKGPSTLVASGGRPFSYNGSGNPGMASAGMGDVLGGILAALIARGLDSWDAARFGVYWHGAAADALAASGGELSVTPSRLVRQLPLCLPLFPAHRTLDLPPPSRIVSPEAPKPC